jgi:hypothetical protein
MLGSLLHLCPELQLTERVCALSDAVSAGSLLNSVANSGSCSPNSTASNTAVYRRRHLSFFVSTY